MSEWRPADLSERARGGWRPVTPVTATTPGHSLMHAHNYYSHVLSVGPAKRPMKHTGPCTQPAEGAATGDLNSGALL